MVDVSASSLAGQPVSVVRSQLQQLGLGVQVVWRPSDQDPGTVLSVQPSGRVRAGSVVAVIAAFQPDRAGYGNGGGD
jgi:beta-lactam-binding protein with PASTA domain